MTTRFNLISRSCLFGGIALSLVACAGEDDGPTPTDAEYDQIAQSLGATSSASGDGAALAIAADLSVGVMPAGLHLSGAGQFTGDHLGLQFDYHVVCLVDGLEVPCTAATDTATVDATWSGSLDLPRIHLDVSRSGRWTLTGLQSATVVVDGTAAFDLNGDFAPASGANVKTLMLGYDAAYAAVAIDRATHVAVGGSIDYALDVTTTHTNAGVDEQLTYAVDATVTFHANGTATLVLDGDRDYTIDLATGVTVAASAN